MTSIVLVSSSMDNHTPMLLILSPLSSTLVAPKATVARHKADNKVLNHIVPNAIEPKLQVDRGGEKGIKRRGRDSQRRKKDCAQFAAGSSRRLRNMKWLKVVKTPTRAGVRAKGPKVHTHLSLVNR